MNKRLMKRWSQRQSDSVMIVFYEVIVSQLELPRDVETELVTYYLEGLETTDFVSRNVGKRNTKKGQGHGMRLEICELK
jgi:hypothetical protein